MPDGRHWGVFAFQSADEAAVRALAGEEITTGTLDVRPAGAARILAAAAAHAGRCRARALDRISRVSRDDGRTYAINFGQGRVYYWR